MHLPSPGKVCPREVRQSQATACNGEGKCSYIIFLSESCGNLESLGIRGNDTACLFMPSTITLQESSPWCSGLPFMPSWA